MGTRFQVRQRKVGGSIDAFRQELGRIRVSAHLRDERAARMARIVREVGLGHVVRQCLVDTGHRNGLEVHVLTSTAVVMVFNERSKKLVTMLVARPGQVRRYYEPFGEEVPQELAERAHYNACVRHWNV